MGTRAQAILIWWGLIFMYIFGFALWGLLHMMPPPPATWSAEQVAQFYLTNASDIKLGAMVAGWTSGFMIPIASVIGLQIARLESGLRPWGVVAVGSGVTMAIPLILPPLFWGVAAYTPTRAPEITAIMHELGTLTLVTTDQWYIFMMVALGVVSLSHKGPVGPSNPFPRWMGYFTLWAAVAFEVGAVAFVTKSGPWAWNGVIVYWMPLTVFGAWVTAVSFTMLRALKHQAQEK
ncbi:MAG TPA: hypothetical protein VFY35_15370 [Burkholderiaceae bacterium]|nr:hypothetical protein [Burkholderiaceae bacterium]